MNDTNQNTNQTDIFGNVTSFEPQPEVNPNTYQPENPVYQNQVLGGQQPVSTEATYQNQVLGGQQVVSTDTTYQNQVLGGQQAVSTEATYQNQVLGGQQAVSTDTTYQNQVLGGQQPVSMEDVPTIDIPQEEKIEIPTSSFNEMPFSGVNQQQEEEEKTTVLENQSGTQSIDDTVERNSNMQPIQKQADENSGLRFLIGLGIIFAVVIILLPFL
jgi:hypothetical protein